MGSQNPLVAPPHRCLRSDPSLADPRFTSPTVSALGYRGNSFQAKDATGSRTPDRAGSGRCTLVWTLWVRQRFLIDVQASRARSLRRPARVPELHQRHWREMERPVSFADQRGARAPRPDLWLASILRWSWARRSRSLWRARAACDRPLGTGSSDLSVCIACRGGGRSLLAA
jgi:hypothetical protein